MGSLPGPKTHYNPMLYYCMTASRPSIPVLATIDEVHSFYTVTSVCGDRLATIPLDPLHG